MIHVEPFCAQHLAQITVQPAQAIDWPDCAERDARARAFAAAKHGRTFRDNAGAVIACFGMIETHEQYLTAWSVLSTLTIGQLTFATRWCREYLAGVDARRIDMFVRAGFEQGQRWAALLGFGHEGVQQHFYPDGADLHVWAMIHGIAVNQEGRAAWPSCR